MSSSEIHSLKSGDTFSFTEGGPELTVAPDSHMIDYEGEMLVLYYSGPTLFGHLCDHTPVWLTD